MSESMPADAARSQPEQQAAGPAPPPSDGLVALNRRLRLAAYLVVCGLAVQAATLVWTRPPTFLVFLGGGTFLVGLGASVYLFAIARHQGHGLVAPPPE